VDVALAGAAVSEKSFDSSQVPCAQTVALIVKGWDGWWLSFGVAGARYIIYRRILLFIPVLRLF